MKGSLLFSAILVLITAFNFGVGAEVPPSVFGDPSTRKALTDVFLNSEIQSKLARIFSIGLLQRFYEKAAEVETRAELPICVLQVISDLNASEPEDLNLVFPPGTSSGIALGAFHSCNNSITGLSTVKDCVKFPKFPPVPITIRLGYSLSTGTLTLSGYHSTALELLLGIFRLQGFGDYEISLENAFLDIDFTLTGHLWGMNVTNLTFDMGFDGFSIEAEESSLNGVNIDWAGLSAEFKDLFDSFWPVLKVAIVEPLISEVLRGIVKDCLLIHLIPIDGLWLKCLETNVVRTGLLESEIKELLNYEVKEGEPCETRLEFPPIPTTVKPGDPIVDIGSGGSVLGFSILTLLTLNFAHAIFPSRIH